MGSADDRSHDWVGSKAVPQHAFHPSDFPYGVLRCKRWDEESYSRSLFTPYRRPRGAGVGSASAGTVLGEPRS
jgi:hypothetical protein